MDGSRRYGRLPLDRSGLTGSIDIDYVDPRSQEKQDADAAHRAELEEAKKAQEDAWQFEVDQAKEQGLPEPAKPEEYVESPVRPDWTQNPAEVGLPLIDGDK